MVQDERPRWLTRLNVGIFTARVSLWTAHFQASVFLDIIVGRVSIPCREHRGIFQAWRMSCCPICLIWLALSIVDFCLCSRYFAFKLSWQLLTLTFKRGRDDVYRSSRKSPVSLSTVDSVVDRNKLSYISLTHCTVEVGDIRISRWNQSSKKLFKRFESDILCIYIYIVQL